MPVQQTHRLAYFDFQELTVARQLAELQRGGATPRWLAKNLALIERKFPDVARPLAVLRLMIEGRTLLVRRGDDLVEPGGQLRIDFDAASRDARWIFPGVKWNLAASVAASSAETSGAPSRDRNGRPSARECHAALQRQRARDGVPGEVDQRLDGEE